MFGKEWMKDYVKGYVAGFYKAKEEALLEILCDHSDRIKRLEKEIEELKKRDKD